MPYTKQDLITLYNLQENEVNQTLTAAGLCVESEFYTDEQIQISFELIRSYFNSGQVSDYIAAAQLFEQHQDLRASEEQQPKSKKSTKGKKSEPLNDFGADRSECLNVLELIAQASVRCGLKIELLEAVQIMPSCGLLPNQSEFTQDECDRFALACQLLKKQNKTIDEVAAHFGVESEVAATNNNIEAGIEQTANALDSSSNGVVSEVMRYKAKADASAAPSFYLQHLAEEFGSPEYQAAWHQMESALKAKIMGKSQQRARQILGKIQAIPPSPSPLSALPKASDNGSTTD